MGLNYKWTAYIVMFQIITFFINADYFYFFLRHREEKRWKIYVWIILASAAGYCAAYPFGGSFLLHGAVYNIVILLAVFRMFYFTVKELIFVNIGFWLIHSIPELSGMYTLGGVLDDYRWMGLGAAMLVCIVIIYKMVGLMVLYSLWRCWKEQILFRYLALFWAFPVFLVVMVLVYIQQMVPFTARVVWIGGVMGVMAYFIQKLLMTSFEEVINRTQTERELTNLYSRRQEERSYYELITEHMEEMRQLKQKFGVEMDHIYELMEQSAGEEIRNERRDFFGQTEVVRYCDNSLLNAIVDRKTKEAETAGVCVYADMRILEEVYIERMDVCSLYCNLLDNAIEAEQRQEEAGDIYLKSEYRDGHLYLKVENTMPEKKKLSLKTVKDHPEEHGYGLQLTKKIAEKYGGELSVSQKAGWFSVEVEL